MLKGERARTILGIIRLVNGTLALLAPSRLVKMFGLNPEANGAAIYALRLFGVRTVYIGLQLLTEEDEALDRAVRHAVFIHASDVAAAVIAGVKGQLPRKAATIGAATSSVNTVLAILARKP